MSHRVSDGINLADVPESRVAKPLLAGLTTFVFDNQFSVEQ